MEMKKSKIWLILLVLVLSVLVGTALSIGTYNIWPNQENNIYAIIIIWIEIIVTAVCLLLKIISLGQEESKKKIYEKYTSLDFCIGFIALFWIWLIYHIHKEGFIFYCVIVVIGTVVLIIQQIKRWRS